MLCRNTGKLELVDTYCLPPILFYNLANAEPVEDFTEPERSHETCCGVARYQPANSWPVEMVVMVVRKEHDIDWREGIELDSGAYTPPRSGEGNGRCPVAPDRIGEDVPAANLQ